MTVCRRCSECQGYSHHWLSNPNFGSDDNRAYEFECKHCEAAGEECPVCDGRGSVSGRSLCPVEEFPDTCQLCNGEGVVVVKLDDRKAGGP